MQPPPQARRQVPGILAARTSGCANTTSSVTAPATTSSSPLAATSSTTRGSSTSATATDNRTGQRIPTTAAAHTTARAGADNRDSWDSTAAA